MKSCTFKNSCGVIKTLKSERSRGRHCCVLNYLTHTLKNTKQSSFHLSESWRGCFNVEQTGTKVRKASLIWPHDRHFVRTRGKPQQHCRILSPKFHSATQYGEWQCWKPWHQKQRVCSGKYLEQISEILREGEKTNLRHQMVGDSVAEIQAYDDLDWTY